MSSKLCHLCNYELFENPIIELNGIPKAAQYFPTVKEFKDDVGIILKIYQCTSCGLVQLNMDPVDYFREVITAASFSEKTRLARQGQMKEIVSKYGLSGGKILEVGSGSGEMIDVLKEVGLHAYGLEASEKSVENGKLAGRNMILGYIGDMENIPGAPFDVFISYNYLEHLPKPGSIIKKIYNNTSSECLGIVTVPNLTYLLETKCFYEFVADHLSYFTENTLKHAFESNGFEVLECNTINNHNDILVIVKKRRLLEIAEHYNEVNTLINNLRKVVTNYRDNNKKVAIWGAGHRTLALLALSKITNIEYIVDSAKFKQGRYTPVMHLNIVPPDHLKKESVDLVIIMVPGLYPSEVKKTIKKMNVDVDLAVLRNNNIEFE